MAIIDSVVIEIQEENMNDTFVIWVSGYRVNAALVVREIGSSDKAIQFEVANNPKIKLWFPRKALTADKNIQNVLNLARWFSFNDFLRSVFDRYADHYNR